MHGRECVAVISQPYEEERCSNRRKQLHRRIKRRDFENDQQEADAVLQRPDVAAIAHALGYRNWDVSHRISTTEERHGAGGRVAEAVRQQVQELAELVCPHRAEARGKVVDLVAGHVAGQAVVERIGQPPVHAGLAAAVTGAHHHIVAFGQLGEQLGNMVGAVLTIGIHEHQGVSSCGAGAALYRRAVAHGVRAAEYADAALQADCRGLVG